MAKKAPNQPKEVKLEDILFNCRDLLRGRAPMQDMRDLLLTLVFFNFVGDRFNERKDAIIEQYIDEPELAAILVEDSSS